MTSENIRLIRLPEVLDKTGIKKSKFYELIAEGKMPKPNKIGNASVWVESELDAALTKFLAEAQAKS